MRKILRLILIIAVFVGAIGIGTYYFKKNGMFIKVLDKKTLESMASMSELPDESGQQKQSFNGLVETDSVYSVSSSVTGKAFEIYVKNGQTIHKGDSIILIDNKEEIEQCGKLWDDTVSEVSAAKEMAKEAIDELESMTPSFESGSLDAKVYQQAVDKADRAREALDIAINKSKSAKLKYDIALNNSMVTAPLDGNIRNLSIKRNKDIKAGDKLCDITDSSFTSVLFRTDRISETRIYPGENVTITAYDKTFKGFIIDIADMPDENSRYVIKAYVEDASDLKDGSDVSVMLQED
ncbi:HlyD family efflux transporter periplasmic adaptor subunit [Oribacterium sp. WCC10]|uniref:HlyD family efflux transporter periplasmic adaptor subunit n=1 Tax=Oribacterium sp. WCC10 TaxID=1855343 RepID=UPI0008F1EF76|nr:HlyD family efflux transporter periplasmic adaptor subunit [Oribacterium sp. WCC10]SFG54161.1 Multidrug efflux pump subunit AcrA (membrane-fusion protein) [Oribacterium sp. WCC10]